MNRQYWQDGINFLIGLWVAVSPFVIGDPSAPAIPALALWNIYAVGGALVLVGIFALFSHRLWEEWVDTALGLWLAVSPFVLGMAVQPMLKWSTVGCGIAVAALAIWAIADERNEARHA